MVRNYYRPQTKLRKGNIFTSVCQEFCKLPGQTVRHPLGRHLLGRYTHLDRHPPGRHPLGRHLHQMATAADGLHPTGMHSCFLNQRDPISVEKFHDNRFFGIKIPTKTFNYFKISYLCYNLRSEKLDYFN